ncbi:hypothetical protein W97_02242 [Coniosporium apollinis CBS 100218]|uniref:SAP domain-containing protein n=1 Tax=Coniosporium apollinis (strain CBS 100218) TaxID=1168221 RepID=R7YMZ8_CONA1|nr:uncharacterized protein W97_02242 [Coniosporium apollinis CBS 100218]EON63016.1 hypothetical protein W97_02242 [Coniosporium apollinis CBS 100218]
MAPTPSTTPSKTTNTTPKVPASSAASPGKEEIKDRLNRQENRTKAVNTNNIARVTNSQLTSADEKLQPLYSLKTNRPLDNFPPTAKNISRLSDIQLDAMLSGLEADRTGSKEQKVERLRMHLGLKPNPP